MKTEPLARLSCSVQPVSDDGAAQSICGMHPDLMSASCVRRELHSCRRASVNHFHREPPEAGHSLFPVHGISSLFRPVVLIKPDWKVNQAFFLFHKPVKQGSVFLPDSPLFKLPLQKGLSLSVSGHYEQA